MKAQRRKGWLWLLVAGSLAGCANRSDRPLARRYMEAVKPGPEMPEDIPEAESPKVLPETHLAAAKLFESQGHLAKALVQYRKAIAVNHNYVEAYHRLGLLLSTLNQRKEALEALQRAVELSPDDAVLRNNLGFELMMAGRWQDAERELSRSLAIKPDFARAHVNMGIVRSKLDRFDDALASFIAALPEADAHYNMGLMYRGQKRIADARAEFEQALALNPNLTAARVQLEQLAANRPAGGPNSAPPATPPAVDTSGSLVRVAPATTPPPVTPPATAPPSPVLAAPPRHSDSPSGLADPPTTGGQAAPTRGAAAPISRGPFAWADMDELLAIAENEFNCIRQEELEAMNTGRGTTDGADDPVDEVLESWITPAPPPYAVRVLCDASPMSFPEEYDELVAEGIVDESPWRSTAAHGRPSRRNEPVGDGSRRLPPPPTMFASVVPADTDPAGGTDAWTEEPVSSIDTWALLRELESAITVVRNEVDCLGDSPPAPARLLELANALQPVGVAWTMGPLSAPSTDDLFGPPWDPPGPAVPGRTLPDNNAARGSLRQSGGSGQVNPERD
jgi:tetratricopeptide (TPR) repeat protein